MTRRDATITTREAADILGCSIRTVEYMIAKGVLRRQLPLRRKQVEALAAARAEKREADKKEVATT